MRVMFSVFAVGLMLMASFAKAESFFVETESGEEVAVNVFPATFAEELKPTLVWFTEGYADRSSFKQVITQLNDAGFTIWQADLLESYFLQRTPTNVRKLTGEGIAAVLEKAQSETVSFVPVSTGRMSLILLRGARLWQLQNEFENGIGKLKQAVIFFPNLYDAPEKAGDAPQLFPIVSATSLPLTVIQPLEGTYRWKLLETLNQLEKHGSYITTVTIPEMRDWYFLRRDPSPVEQKASAELASQISAWLDVGTVNPAVKFQPKREMKSAQVTEKLKGLVEVTPRMASDFTLTDIAQHSLSLSEKNGKVILLNFWASWCPPCVKEIPSMNRLAQSFQPEQFEIVSVNFKETSQTIRDFLAQVHVDFPVLVDIDGKVSADYEIFSFPSSFLIDTNGRIRYSVNAAIEWDEPQVQTVIEQLISEKE